MEKTNDVASVLGIVLNDSSSIRDLMQDMTSSLNG